MTDPQPTKHHSTSPFVRLWRAAFATGTLTRFEKALRALLRGVVPADDPLCEHGYGAGYCPGEICPHSDGGGR